jgi:hypothetical protein
MSIIIQEKFNEAIGRSHGQPKTKTREKALALSYLRLNNVCPQFRAEPGYLCMFLNSLEPPLEIVEKQLTPLKEN